ncbi:PAAR domain-containing protein [Pseudomonas sp. JQ170]|uniref:PAAR domain-containing protein n=1 Tax=unclassified Pseudomonas TaxID=196821 RepID=UPI0026538C77|nr:MULTISPECIES: PAAR domain-containing protein [unclassified Pseudomonas]MDN7141694.1 PAAR domain-containing protein [Pseudomonas sp. JQ170]WRO75353.1 PAAR domain-containing protein [Pseudomonas sp. 170C]
MGKRANMFGRGEGLHGDKTTSGATCISSLPQAAHSGRGVLRRGDSTTPCPKCSKPGTIVEGDSRFTFQGIPVALDGMLVSCGCPPGTNRLVAPLGEWIGPGGPASSSSAEAANPASAVSSPSPASSFAGTRHATPVMSATPGTLEPGFYIVPRSMSGPQVLARLGNPYLSAGLHRLNPTFSQGFKAGELFILGDPDKGTACTREEAQLMGAAAQVREALAELSEAEADFMVKYQGEIAGLLEDASLSMGVGTAMLGRGLQQVDETLRAIEQLHQRSFAVHGHLNSPDFFAARQQLRKNLDAQLKSAFLNKYLNLGSYDTLRRDLGISTKSLVHHWSRAGGPGQIPGYATHLDQVAKAAKYLKYGGYVGIALGGGASLLKVKEACRAGETEECQKIRFTEAGSLTGGIGGSVAGAYLGGYTAYVVCGVVAAATGGVGGAVCGIVLVGGGSIAGGVSGGALGEKVGESIYEGQK